MSTYFLHSRRREIAKCAKLLLYAFLIAALMLPALPVQASPQSQGAGGSDQDDHTIYLPLVTSTDGFAGNTDVPVDDGIIVSAAINVQVGLVVDSDTSTIRSCLDVPPSDNSVLSAYTKPNQSRLWYNSVQDRWDALMPRLDSGTSDHYVLKDVAGSQTFTTIELEDRDFGRPDVFWDEGNQKLYVFSSHPASSEFWRLGYDAASDNYNLEVGALGAGVAVPGITHPSDCIGGNSPGTLYVTPNGHVWVAVMKGGSGLQVQHSADGGTTWMAAPVTLDVNAKLGVTTWIHFENNGIDPCRSLCRRERRELEHRRPTSTSGTSTRTRIPPTRTSIGSMIPRTSLAPWARSSPTTT